jgi:hypothetical protein
VSWLMVAVTFACIAYQRSLGKSPCHGLN